MSTSRRLRRRARGRGSVATEIALTLPAFAVMLIGVLEYGWVMPMGTTLEHVARDAARVGALSSDDTLRVTLATARATQRIGETPFDVDDVTISVSEITLPTSGDTAVQVDLTAQYKALFGLVPTPLTLNGSATMRAELQP